MAGVGQREARRGDVRRHGDFGVVERKRRQGFDMAVNLYLVGASGEKQAEDEEVFHGDAIIRGVL